MNEGSVKENGESEKGEQQGEREKEWVWMGQTL